MKLSICIITKNESEKLKKCLEHIKLYPWEIVVVDTGSTDDSVEVARKYTDSVYNFVWCDDFSKARNFAASMAKHNMIFALDTDEFVYEADVQELEKLLVMNRDKVGRFHRRNYFTLNGEDMSSDELVNRIYDRTKYCYEGMIHEQIVSIDGKMYDTYVVPIYSDHVGYTLSSDDRRKKGERNLRLLLASLDREEDSLYTLYQIGKAYYYMGDYINAAEYFEKTFELELDSRLEWVKDMITTYGYALINSEQFDRALSLENLYEEFKSYADYLFMMGLIYMKNALFDDAIYLFELATKGANASVKGTNSYLAYYNIGVIYECLGRVDKSLEYYGKCGKYEKAKKRKEALRR